MRTFPIASTPLFSSPSSTCWICITPFLQLVYQTTVTFVFLLFNHRSPPFAPLCDASHSSALFRLSRLHLARLSWADSGYLRPPPCRVCVACLSVRDSACVIRRWQSVTEETPQVCFGLILEDVMLRMFCFSHVAVNI